MTNFIKTPQDRGKGKKERTNRFAAGHHIAAHKWIVNTDMAGLALIWAA
jgi:hypothetical protein